MDMLDNLKEYQEHGVTVLADGNCTTSRKTPFYYCQDLKVTRSFVTCILSHYVNNKESVCYPVKCIDVIGSSGICGLLWKKHLGEKVDVKLNDPRSEACKLINDNALKNQLVVDITNQDPCIVLHERGYNFIYLDCTNEASHFFDAAFRNISRNGILIITAKDDCSMHGNNPDVAMRRYGGRITRTLYYQELGIRLFVAAMARAAVRYNKSISVLCCMMDRSRFTVAVVCRKGPALANTTIENIRSIKHCMVCEDREFYPIPTGFPIEPASVKLSCKCAENAPGNTCLELGPVWSGPVFNVDFLEGMAGQEITKSDIELEALLTVLLQEAKCLKKESAEKSAKRLKIETLGHPPFYYNIHKHHPQLNQLMKINKVIEGVKESGYRASKTHFDKLAVRTDAPLQKLLTIMQNLDKPN